MDPERWQRIEDLFERALERDADELESFLAAACAGSPDLRREVETLVAAHRRAGDFIERPAPREGLPLLGQEVTWEGRRIGARKSIRPGTQASRRNQDGPGAAADHLSLR